MQAGRGRVGGSVASGGDEVFLRSAWRCDSSLPALPPRAAFRLALFCSLISVMCSLPSRFAVVTIQRFDGYSASFGQCGGGRRRAALSCPLPFSSLQCGGKTGWIQGANHKIAAGRKGGREKAPNPESNPCSCVLLTGCGCVPLPTKPWKGSGCHPRLRSPSDARTVLPHPAHKKLLLSYHRTR